MRGLQLVLRKTVELVALNTIFSALRIKCGELSQCNDGQLRTHCANQCCCYRILASIRFRLPAWKTMPWTFLAVNYRDLEEEKKFIRTPVPCKGME